MRDYYLPARFTIGGNIFRIPSIFFYIAKIVETPFLVCYTNSSKQGKSHNKELGGGIFLGKLYVRVDDRLIHGQIVTAWCITLGIEQIIAVDDKLASNSMMQSIMTMGVPGQYHPKIVTAAQAKELLTNPSDKTRLLITRFCRNLSDLRQKIQGCEYVNLGNCSKQPDSRYEVRGFGVGQVFSFTEEDVNTLNALEADGITIVCQQLPTEKKRTWSDLKNAF